MIIFGISAGLLVAGGVFTVVLSVGLTPRFAEKTKTEGSIIRYENMIVLGTIAGAVCSTIPIAEAVYSTIPMAEAVCSTIPMAGKLLGAAGWLAGRFLLLCSGFSTGIFVGCLAMAIAEMLNSIPIFTRRIHLQQGLGIAIWAVAMGKLAGAFLHLYFFAE